MFNNLFDNAHSTTHALIIFFIASFILGRLLFPHIRRWMAGDRSTYSTDINIPMAIISSVISLMLTGLITANCFYAIGLKNMIVRENKITTFSKPMVISRWSSLMEGASIVSFEPTVTELSRSFNPVTPNPKVRNFQYSFKVSTTGTPEGKLLFMQSFPQGQEQANSWVKSVMYDFEEEKSKEIALLHNPEDEAEKKMFTALLAEYMNPHLLPRGLLVTAASFQNGPPPTIKTYGD